MKKFEEEINKKVGTFDVVGHHNGVCCLFEEVKAFGKDWVSPEDHQAEIDKRKQQYEDHQEIYSKTAKKLNEAELELSKLKSQLEKQQPEIPEFVANHIEATKEDFWTLLSAMNDSNISSRLVDWLKGGNFRNQEIFAQAWLNGYTVAKEKRFYLKHKSVLIFDPDSDDSDVEELYLGAGGNFVPYKHLAKIFTQSEIDSMETGSYEQIGVEE